MTDLITAIAAIVLGPLATFGLYALLNLLVNLLPTDKVREAVRPYVFIGPVLLLIGILLVYPTIQSMVFSFMNADSSEFIGFKNYEKLFADPSFLITVGNNLLWVAIVPITTIIFGLFIATLTDKLGPVRERLIKSVIFMPMAISFVSAATMWSLAYNFAAPGRPQIGMLNAIIQALGGTPQPWMTIDSGRLNSFLLMIIVVWLQAGFSMVLLSAAIKAVPEETIEAAADEVVEASDDAAPAEDDKA